MVGWIVSHQQKTSWNYLIFNDVQLEWNMKWVSDGIMDGMSHQENYSRSELHNVDRLNYCIMF